MIYGEMEPKSPAWLTQRYNILRGLGYTPVADRDNPGTQYAQQTEAVGLDYLALFLTEQDRALASMGNYFGRFGEINRAAGILSSLTAEQFGMIANIASLHYATFDQESLHLCLTQVAKYLNDRNSRSIPGLTAKLRKPQLVRDLVAHRQNVNYPADGPYGRFLQQNADWETVRQHIELRDNNPVLFAVTIPHARTDAEIRERFREAYPELAAQGIEIIAARLYNQGAHDEILSADPYLSTAARYKGWEDSIYDTLEYYGPEYRHDILEAIAAARWNIFDDEELSFSSLLEKITHTSFTLNENGMLARHAR